MCQNVFFCFNPVSTSRDTLAIEFSILEPSTDPGYIDPGGCGDTKVSKEKWKLSEAPGQLWRLELWRLEMFLNNSRRQKSKKEGREGREIGRKEKRKRGMKKGRKGKRKERKERC